MQAGRVHGMKPYVMMIALFSLGGGFPTQNREIYDKGQCRLSYGRSIRVISVALSLRVQSCHRERLRGNVPATVDCSDPWSWQAGGYAVGHAGLVHDLRRYDAESKECTATVNTPDQVGYLTCPAPCDAIPITNFAAFGDCLECHNQPVAVNAWKTALGFPPVSGDGPAINCQAAIGRSVVRYVGKRMKLQTGCEFKHEVSKDGYENLTCIDIGAPAHPLATRINRFRARLIDLISRRCAGVDAGALLDTCGSDGASIGLCVVTAVEQWTATVHTPTYPPLPPL